MSRVSKPPEIRRRELLDAAAELFLRKGYEATSVRDILSKVGGQPGMFYYYFPSTAEIFRTSMDDFVEGYVHGVTALLEDKSRSYSERFRAALALAANSLARFNVAIDLGASAEHAGLFLQNCLDFMDRLVDPAADLLREIDPKRSPEDARLQARFFLYGMYSLMHDPQVGGSEPDLLRAAEWVYPTAARLLDLPLSTLKGDSNV